MFNKDTGITETQAEHKDVRHLIEVVELEDEFILAKNKNNVC